MSTAFKTVHPFKKPPNPKLTPATHAGWRARKVGLTSGSFVTLWTTATPRWLALDTLDAAQWTDFCQRYR